MQAVQLKPSQYVPFCIALGVILCACVAQWAHLPVFERLEWMTYDLRVRKALKFNSQNATNLGFVSIDEKTIQLVRWSFFGDRGPGLYWPRHVYGRLVHELAEQGAKCVAFDVIFGELRGDHASVQFRNTTNWVESDEYFTMECASASNVVLAVSQGLMPPPFFLKSAAAIGDVSTDKDSDGILRRAKAFRYYTNWHGAFRQMEEDPFLGVDLTVARVETNRVVLPRSPDPITGEKFEPIEIPLNERGQFDMYDIAGTNLPPGVDRFSTPLVGVNLFWHMGVILAANALGLDLEKARIDLRKGWIELPDREGRIQRRIPVDEHGFFYVDWSMPPNHPALFQQPMHQLLHQDILRLRGETNELVNTWRGKIAVVGSSALANDLSDRGATPLFKDNLLVSKHWNVANSIISDRFVRRLPLWLEMGVTVLLGALTAWLTWSLRSSPMAFAVVFLIAIAYVLAGLVVYVQDRLWLPYVFPLAAASLTQIGMLTWRVAVEQAARRRVRAMFSKMVSPKIVNELLKRESLSLGGARHEITVFFADVRGFTELTVRTQQETENFIRERGLEGAEAEAFHDHQARETLNTVNTYLDVIAQVVTGNDGTLDKFIGDCVMAFWGAPTANSRHATACVHAAIDAQIAVRRLNEERTRENQRRKVENETRKSNGQEPLPDLPLLNLGTGINTGMATAGLMGSARADSLSYTVFGREVNLASRLEGASGHGRIFISENTMRHLRRDDPELAAKCLPREPVHLKGFSMPILIYEVPWHSLDGNGEANPRIGKSEATAPADAARM